MKTPVLLLVVLLVALPLPAAESADQEAVRQAVEKAWLQIRSGELGPGTLNPRGVSHAAGGIWQYLSPKELAAQLQESGLKPKLTPRQVKVRFVGPRRDVAYVSFHLGGESVPAGRSLMTEIRTPASALVEMIDGKWRITGIQTTVFLGGGMVSALASTNSDRAGECPVGKVVTCGQSHTESGKTWEQTCTPLGGAVVDPAQVEQNEPDERQRCSQECEGTCIYEDCYDAFTYCTKLWSCHTDRCDECKCSE